jgi:hypothetical protein
MPKSTGHRPTGDTSLRDLPTTLRAASSIVQELRSNPELSRLITAFFAMPPSDRPIVLTAIESEVQARKLSLATEDVTGQSMFPSPHARLYLRAHERERSRLPIDRHDMMLAMLAGMRASTLLVGELHETWLGSVRDTISHLDATTRAIVTSLVRDALCLLEDPNVRHDSEP